MDLTITKKRQLYVILILFKNIFEFYFLKKYVSEWEIKSEDLLSHGRMVGRGTYGTVYKAEVRLHGIRVSCLILKSYAISFSLSRICGVKRIELRFTDTKSISSISK